MVCGWLPGEEWQLGVESKTSGSTCKPSDTLMDDALFERAAVMLALGAYHPIAFKLDPISTETTVELCALAKQAVHNLYERMFLMLSSFFHQCCKPQNLNTFVESLLNYHFSP